MFHVELFSSSIASGANTFAQINYVTSPVLPKLVNGVQISPMLPYFGFICGVSANLVHLRAQTPAFLPYPYPTFDPNNRGSAVESPPRMFDFYSTPLPVNPTDEFDIFGTQNAGAAQTPFVLVGFCTAKPTPLPVAVNPASVRAQAQVPGRFTTVHWTASTTLNASAFTTVTPILDAQLPAGMYALVGARVFSASALFFRMLPGMEPLWRPGGVAVQAYDQLDPPGQRAMAFDGNLELNWGVWLNFYQNIVPQVEIFATAGDTAEEGWFDLVYLGAQTSAPMLTQ